jgi:hypothetical protein
MEESRRRERAPGRQSDFADNPGLTHPHDLLARHFLVNADLTADLLRNHVDPSLTARLDLSRLKYESSGNVDKNLLERTT